jgi:hypothetical protein
VGVIQVSATRNFLIGAVVLFGGIGMAAWIKKSRVEPKRSIPQIVEIPVHPIVVEPPLKKEEKIIPPAPVKQSPKPLILSKKEAPEAIIDDFPIIDRIGRLFALDSSKLPIVETVSFTSRVPWLKGRPAWVADYASYYETSRHFIARSLNRKPDYFTQKISPGDRFNVFRKDKNIQFHLLIDLSKCRMLFYYIDQDAGERVLLKTYRVGIGRQDASRSSGYLTPVGKYSIGEKVAIYKPDTTGFFNNQKIEMIRVFGTRWIPFDKEIEGCSEEAKGFGLHGAPWINDPSSGLLVEDRAKLGKYDSDGCIRLSSDDIEELFAIILTKPTVVELVKDFHDTKLPGVEKNIQ